MKKKYIITRDAKPMYAMATCCGPQMGPLFTPTPTSDEIIKDILMQKDGPVLYEVIPENPQLTKYSRPVKLTLENYKLPYNEILGPILAAESAKKDVETLEPEVPPTPETEKSANLRSVPVQDEDELTDEELEALTNPDF